MEEAWNTQRMAFSPKPTNEEEWGIMVSAILPIVKDGRTLALLGVDYDISYVNALRQRVLIFLVVAFTASVFLIGLLSVLGSHTLLVPIEEQTKIADEAKERNAKIESLMASQKKSFALKNSFMTSLTDEMTNPINAVIETSTAMVDDPSASPDQKKNFEAINDAGILLLNAMNEIKEISRLESGKAEIHSRNYELPNLIHDITSLYTSHTAGSDVIFKIEIDNNTPLRISGDDLHIKKVCHNLLTNAFKYTTKGTITFKVSCKQEAGILWLTMKIIDTGLGMTRRGLDSLLVDYAKMDVTGKVQMGGVSGLGLYIARRMTEMMKGTLTASSEQGKGSVFTLRVPQKQLSKETISAQTIEKLKTFKYVKTSAKTTAAATSYADNDFDTGIDIDDSDLFK
jgi:signal transduction histidine kinase